MCDSHDDDTSGFDAVDDAVRKTTQEKSTRSVIASRPGRRCPFDLGGSYVKFVRESDGSRRTALGIPPRRFFGLFECLVEVLKRAGHGRLQRRSGDGSPTMTRSLLDPRRAAGPGDRSPRTTPPRRPHRRANQGSRSAPRPELRVLQVRAKAPPRAIPWRPYLEEYHVGSLAPALWLTTAFTCGRSGYLAVVWCNALSGCRLSSSTNMLLYSRISEEPT